MKPGLKDDFIEAIRESIVKYDSMDLPTISIARRYGFSVDELWQAVGEVTSMIEDDNVREGFRQKLRLADEIRKSRR